MWGGLATDNLQKGVCVCVWGGGLATDNLQKGDSGGINLGGQTMADQRKMPNL